MRMSFLVAIPVLVALMTATSACARSTPAPSAAPTIAAPTTAAPATAAPTVSAQSTMAPTVAAPATTAPTVAALATAVPTVAAPTITVPTVAGPSTAAPTVAVPTVAAPTTSAPAGAGLTASQLADQGKAVFASHCAKCHGDQGQGVTAPANIGPNANLGKFDNAQGLYSYVSSNMPQDAPGSLSPQEYLQVTSFLLVQNNFVTPQTPISTSTLDRISLTK